MSHMLLKSRKVSLLLGVLVLGAVAVPKLRSQNLSREYIRMGGRVIAIEGLNVTVAPSSLSFRADGTATSGSSASLTITTPFAMAWTVTAPTWVDFTPGSGTTALSGGIYTSTVTVSAQINGGANRSGTLTVNIGGGTLTVAVSQTGGLSISPPSVDVSSTSSTGTTSVSAPSGVAWSAVVGSGSAWLSITSGSSGTGNGSVNYNVAQNATSQDRSGWIDITGAGLQPVRFTVRQSASAGTTGLSFDPSSVVVSSAGGNFTTRVVSALADTAWNITIIDGAGWLTANPLSGTGTATIGYQVQPWFGTYQREGKLKVTANNNPSLTATFTVAINPPAVSLSTAPTALGAPSHLSEPRVVRITANASWTATPNAPWIVLVPGYSVGSGSAAGEDLRFTLNHHNGATPRTGTITVRAGTGSGAVETVVTVTQAVVETLSIGPPSLVLSAGKVYTFTAYVDGVADNAAVNWSASIGTVSEGVYTAPGSVTSGFLFATHIGVPSKTATANVSVQPGVDDLPQAIFLSPNSGTGTGALFSVGVRDPVAFANIGSVKLRYARSLSYPYTFDCLVRMRPTSTSTAEADILVQPYPQGSLPSTPASPNLETQNCGLLLRNSSMSGVTDKNMVANFALDFKDADRMRGVLGVSVTNAEGWEAPAVEMGTYTSVGAPTSTSVSPNTGAGTTQTFTAVYSYEGGAANLKQAELLINTSTSAAAKDACYVRYRVAENKLYLKANIGNGASNELSEELNWLGGYTPGTSFVIQNSQCSLAVGSATRTISGNQLTLSLPLTFTPSFSGSKAIHLSVRDNIDVGSGMVNRGGWIVDYIPTVQSVVPGSGSGRGGQFTATYSDLDGAADLRYLGLLINSVIDRAQACYVIYAAEYGALWLLGDNGADYLGPVYAGQPNVAQNSRCMLTGLDSQISISGQTIDMRLNLIFKAAFVGSQNIYLNAWDTKDVGNGGTGAFQQLGQWTVTAGTAPVIGTLSPAIGSGATQTFTATFTDADGFRDVTSADFLINTTTSVANGCLVRYGAVTRLFWLVGDDGATHLGPLLQGGSGTIENSQCRVSASGLTASGAGSTLTLTIPITFKPTFNGLKNIYLLAWDADAPNAGGWVIKGTWTP